MIVRSVALVVTLVVCVAAAGCGDDDSAGDADGDGNGAQAEFCDDLEAFANTFTDWSDLSLDSSRQEFEEQLDATRDALGELRESGREFGEAQLDELESAYQELEEAVTNIDGDTPTSDAINEILNAAVDVGSALTSTLTLADCRDA